MDPSKFDAWLARHLADSPPPDAPIDVQLRAHTPITPEVAATLATHGISARPGPSTILSIRATPETLRRLTDLPWIVRLSLSQPLQTR